MINLMRFFRILLIPIIRYVLPLMSQKLKERVRFEQKNWTHVPALQSAEYGFEISSEGELEQTKVLLLEVLEAGKTAELLFSSPSVESQCQELIEKYPQQLRIYRLPLITYNPFSKVNNPVNWMTCETLFMCRYDFFPELIHYGKHKAQNFYLIAGSLKNYAKKNGIVKKYLKECYAQFDKIVCVTKEDQALFQEMLKLSDERILIYDFRVLRILDRLEHKEDNIKQRVPQLTPVLDFLTGLTHKKVVFGSYWAGEFPILKKSLKEFLRQGTQVFIAPHELNQNNIDKIIQDFEQIEVPLYMLHKDTTQDEIKAYLSLAKEKPGVWILNIKGILCELYAYFDIAYVGGGFGVSIHSVLEPYMAGAIVFCGPKVHRSTEYSLIKENNPDRVYKVNKKTMILPQMEEVDPKLLSSHENFKNHYITHKASIFKWLGVSK